LHIKHIYTIIKFNGNILYFIKQDAVNFLFERINNMKYIHLLCSFVIACTLFTPLNGAVFTDIYGTHVRLGDEGPLNGPGLTVLWDGLKNWNVKNVLLFADLYGASSKEDEDEPVETTRFYAPLTAGAEYRYMAFSFPLYLTVSAKGGAVYYRKEGPKQYGPYTDPSSTGTFNETGAYCAADFGLLLVLSQQFSLIMRAGYQQPFGLGDAVEDSAGGMQYSIGIRYTFSGFSRSLDYE